uniref:Uncharacterized protein n=1 Tax=Strongyloides stercoralis TaxID=6248 RepID=A0AAF5DP80_STRER
SKGHSKTKIPVIILKENSRDPLNVASRMFLFSYVVRTVPTLILSPALRSHKEATLESERGNGEQVGKRERDQEEEGVGRGREEKRKGERRKKKGEKRRGKGEHKKKKEKKEHEGKEGKKNTKKKKERKKTHKWRKKEPKKASEF